MRIIALRQTEMVGELAARRAVVSSTTESMVGRLPDKTF
jgi:hypothetical protein